MRTMRKMKDSGIEWIGNIPESWDIIRIKDIGTYRNGLTYSPKDITENDNGTLVLRSSNIKNGKIIYDDTVYVKCPIPLALMVKIGDIIICSRNGSRNLIGKNAIIENSDISCSFGAFMMVYRCSCPRYIYYILNSEIFSYYLGTFLTSTINQLTGNNFGNMKIVFCKDIDEQKRIVSFLDAKCAEIDALSDDIRNQIDTLEQYKHSVIFEAVTRGLNPTIDMKDSGVPWIGRIPVHWKRIRLKDKWVNKKEIVGSHSEKYARLALTLAGVVKRSKKDTDGLQPKDFMTYQVLKRNDFIFKMIDLQNFNTSRVGLSSYTGIVSPAYIRFVPQNEVQCYKFTYYFLMSMYYSHVYNSLGDDGVRSSLSASDIGNFYIPWPDWNEQQTIANYLDTKCADIDTIIAQKQEQLNILADYKKSFIYEYVTGKKEVPQHE